MAVRTFDVSIITPYEATNLVTNPTPTAATTGYTGFTATIARDTTKTRRGIASIAITAAAAPLAAGVYYTLAVTSGVTYTVSVDIFGASTPGTWRFQIYNAVPAKIFDSPDYTVGAYWRRISYTFTALGTENYRFYVVRNNPTDATVTYVDGLQIEVGSEATTYIDGDQRGYTNAVDYRWNGTNGASTSTRSGQTLAGGRRVKLSTYCKVLSLSGMSMTPLTNIGVPSTLGRGYYQTTVNNERDFSIVCNINKAGDYGLIEQARAALVGLVNPDKVTIKQPLTLIVNQYDSNGAEVAEEIRIPCHYQGGLEGLTGNSWNERFSINFHAFVPMFRQDGQTVSNLGFTTSVANANYIIQRSAAGVWSALGTGAAGGQVNAIVEGLDGIIYAGGAFTSMGGIANTYGIAKWSGTAWSALGTGASDGEVKTIAVGPDGGIYVGGSFTLMGGVASTGQIARWNGTTWSSLGTGSSDAVSDGGVESIVFGSNGTLYAGGAFTLMGGVASTRGIASFSAGTWSAMGTGTSDGEVRTLLSSMDGYIYAGGTFTLMGGVAGTATLARWLPASTTTGTWSASPAAFSIGTPDALFENSAGRKYALGQSTLAFPIFAELAGTVWTIRDYGLAYGPGWARGNGSDLWIGFPEVNGLTDALSSFNGSTYSRLDVFLPPATIPSTTAAQAICYSSRTQVLYIGFNQAGTAAAAANVSTTASNTIAYPRFTFIGPGTCSQVRNATTGKAVFFNLEMQPGETAVLDLDPYNPRFYSGWRGDLLGTILPGSSLDFELLPGTNNVSAFYSGSTTSDSAIVMTWRNQYNGIDAAVR